MATSVPISFEFYPPKTDEQRTLLDRSAAKLRAHAPEYVSCTFGAGGSTLSYTPETVQRLREKHALDAAPHLSCMGGSREEIRQLLKLYRAMGCRRLVALRGDLPSGMARMGDLRHFKAKVDAGADSAITQYFYNADAYFRFVDDARKAGITIPIIPGIMPISNFSQLSRFSEACGAEIPRWMAKRLQAYGDDVESIREFTADVVAALCRRLVDGGVPELHFYTLNVSRPTQMVLTRLC